MHPKNSYVIASQNNLEEDSNRLGEFTFPDFKTHYKLKQIVQY